MKRISLYLILVCVGSISITARAADTKAEPDVVSVSGPFRGVEPLSINVDFPGGSVNKLIAAVAKADPVSFTVVFNGMNPGDSADFAKVELPAFSLRNVNLISVVEILGTLLQERGFKIKPVGGPNSFVCIVQKIPANEKPDIPQILFLSHQLAPFLPNQSVDEIVGALHAAWELDPSHAADLLRVRFHPGTSILLVSGPPEAINITRNVLAQLKRPDEQKTPVRTTESAQEKK